LLSVDNELELFKDNLKVKTVSNPPVDSSTKMITLDNKVHFINGQGLYKLSMK
jgi:hypothetical protein